MPRLAGAFLIAVFAVLPSEAFAQSGKPLILSITNAASYSTGPISPGEMVTIFGSSLGPAGLVNLTLDGQGRIATSLSEVQILFDGVAAPLLYVSQNQLSAMVPYAIAGRQSSQVQAVYRDVASNAFSKTVALSAPGIFTADSSGKRIAAAINGDGTVNTTSNPVTPGSYLTLFLTGEGQTNPPGIDGNIASSTANTVLPVSVRLGGRLVQSLYTGSAPGNVNGFAQLNVAIPADLPFGGNLPLGVQIGEAFSQPELTVAVAGPPAPLPGTPQLLQVVITPSNQIALTIAVDNKPNMRVHIERGVGAGAFSEIASVLVPANVIPPTQASLTFTDQDVTMGTQYNYRIRAEGDYGFSGYSNTVGASVPTPQVSPPSNVQSVAVSQIEVKLTWNAANTNATNFQIERKTGAAGTYAPLATVPNTQTTYQDVTVVANTAYVYRMRSQSSSGLSGYSNESSVSTPALPLPPAPVIQASAVSSSQIHLSWISTATGILRFRIERRASTGQYAEINQPGPTATAFDDLGLNMATVYSYRIRVETSAGLSPYSNETTATTMQGLPAAPTNLTGVAPSSTQVNLAWTNNARDATAIRVESQAAGSASFTDIGGAASLITAGLTSLLPNTNYRFRVRAQSSAGFSGYSNEAVVTTLPPPKTVFLVHGLNQTHLDMKNLALNLASPYGLAAGRFTVDYGFDFSDCVESNPRSCGSTCTIPGGAQRLAQHIVDANPPGDVVVIGFSLGGLIARDMIANNRIILNGRKIDLVTIGTPNLGYPYLPTDSLVFCSAIVSAMDGNWRAQAGSVRLSNYLFSLTNQWSNYGFPGNGRVWFAASGRAIGTPTRLGSGCKDTNPFSDGVVCQDSAAYNVTTSAGTQPNRSWDDPNRIYVHSFSGVTSLILGNTSDQIKYMPLYDPPPVPGGLFSTLTAILNQM